jgi:hypothetical protein
MRYTLRLRRDTSASWALDNPILDEGEPGLEKNTGRLKIGDGYTAWNDLEYFSGEGSDTDLQEHVDSDTPHPVYDDGPSLTLLYENAKV